MNAALVRYVPGWFVRQRLDHDKHDMAQGHPEGEPLRQHVVLCGYGRVGSSIGKALDAFDLPYVVIERNPDVIRRLQVRHIACLYGDASHRELLTKAGAPDASLVIVVLPEIEPAALTVSRIRNLNPKVAILARAHGAAEAERLGAIGATEVIQPEVEASATLIRHALAWFGVPKDRMLDYVEHYRQSMETKRPTS